MKRFLTFLRVEGKLSLRCPDGVIFGIGMPVGVLLLIAVIAGSQSAGGAECICISADGGNLCDCLHGAAADDCRLPGQENFKAFLCDSDSSAYDSGSTGGDRHADGSLFCSSGHAAGCFWLRLPHGRKSDSIYGSLSAGHAFHVQHRYDIGQSVQDRKNCKCRHDLCLFSHALFIRSHDSLRAVSGSCAKGMQYPSADTWH